MGERPVCMRYRVVGIRMDGTREVCSQNLFRTTAEAAQAALIAGGEYQSVVIQRQPKSRRKPD